MDKSLVEKLIKARELISDPKRWTQGCNARDTNDKLVLSESSDAVCWCSDGALIKVADSGDYEDLHRMVAESANVLYGNAMCYISHITVNDTKTHEEVLAMFDHAIEAAKSEG